MVRGDSELNLHRQAQAAIVFSGPVCAGKSSVAQAVAQGLGAGIVTARAILIDQLEDREPTRRGLQEVGSKLEKSTSGRWLVPPIKDIPTSDVLIFDAARTRRQIEAVRAAFDDVFHCHITASRPSREARFQGKRGTLAEDLSFGEVSADPIESTVDELGDEADLLLDSTAASTDDLAQKVIHSWKARREESASR